jgi:hypothetical protein
MCRKRLFTSTRSSTFLVLLLHYIQTENYTDFTWTSHAVYFLCILQKELHENICIFLGDLCHIELQGSNIENYKSKTLSKQIKKHIQT